MSPTIILTEPERSNEFKQGYKEGYEAGRCAIAKELRLLAKSVSEKELTYTSSSTCTPFE